MEHGEHKNRLIVNIYEKWGLILRSTGARLGRQLHIEEDIHSFLGNQCHKSPQEIHRIFFSNGASHKHIIAEFISHLDDRT